MVKEIEEEVCIDLIGTLKQIKYAVDAEDAESLKELSNHTIHCSSIYLEKRALYIAMITYSLSRIIEKGPIKKANKKEFEDFTKNMKNKIENLINFLEERKFQKIDECIKKMFKDVSNFDKYFGKYIKDVLDFSRIQKGTKIYEHGLSLSSVAELIGISKWDLMEKVGETKEFDSPPEDIKERFQRLKKIIEGK